jgi:type VI secretion system lysozyme-like protein
LLDRLQDDQPHSLQESQPLRVLPIKTWKESLLRDLDWLLNTVCPASVEELKRRSQRTVLEYGLVDFSTYFTQSPVDQQRLIQMLTETLSAYEPRLRISQITIATTPQGESHRHLQVGLNARVEGTVLIDKEAESISFMIQETVAGRKEIISE